METTLLFISFFIPFYVFVDFIHAVVLIFTNVNLTSFKKCGQKLRQANRFSISAR